MGQNDVSGGTKMHSLSIWVSLCHIWENCQCQGCHQYVACLLEAPSVLTCLNDWNNCGTKWCVEQNMKQWSHCKLPNIRRWHHQKCSQILLSEMFCRGCYSSSSVFFTPNMWNKVITSYLLPEECYTIYKARISTSESKGQVQVLDYFMWRQPVHFWHVLKNWQSLSRSWVNPWSSSVPIAWQ